MSWDPYVETLVSAGFHHCCIAGHNGQVWGATPAFKILPAELQKLAALLNDEEGFFENIRRKGFTLCGMPYALNRLDDPEDELRFLVARCKKNGKPARGAIVGRTAKTIIVGIHDPVYSDGHSFGRGKIAVFQLAESLSGMNF